MLSYTPVRLVLAGIGMAAVCAGVYVGCTQEQQNRISREIQNFTGTNGVLDVLGGNGTIVFRFIKIDKISTATATSGASNDARPYRYGYGVMDKNQNYKQDADEKKLYFEVSDYSTPYVFYENPVPE